MFSGPKNRPAIHSAKCPRCKGASYRIPRLPSQKRLPGSKRFRCEACDVVFLRWMGLTLNVTGRGLPRPETLTVEETVVSVSAVTAEGTASNAPVELSAAPAVNVPTPKPIQVELPEVTSENLPEPPPPEPAPWKPSRLSMPDFSPITSKFRWPGLQPLRNAVRMPDLTRYKIRLRWPDFSRLKIDVNWAGMVRIKAPTLSEGTRKRAKSLGGYAAIALGIIAVLAALYGLWFVLLPHLLSGDKSIRF